MTFTPNVPVATQSPSQFPPQNGTNFTRLKALINAEHVFNDTAAADDGVHRQMTMVARLTPVALPAGTNGMYYAKTIGGKTLPFYWDGTSEYALTPARAYITWDSTGTAQGTPFNATVAGGAGTYTITFTTAIPSLYPQMSFNCLNAGAGFAGTAVPVITGFTQAPAGSIKTITVQFIQSGGLAPILRTAFTQASLIVFGG